MPKNQMGFVWFSYKLKGRGKKGVCELGLDSRRLTETKRQGKRKPLAFGFGSIFYSKVLLFFALFLFFIIFCNLSYFGFIGFYPNTLCFRLLFAFGFVFVLLSRRTWTWPSIVICEPTTHRKQASKQEAEEGPEGFGKTVIVNKVWFSLCYPLFFICIK